MTFTVDKKTPTLGQAAKFINLLNQTRWDRKRVQRFFKRWALHCDLDSAISAGKITEEQVRALLQSRPEVDINLAFWEVRFPGKSGALMKVLSPFYGWKPEFRSAIPNLAEKDKQAVFWRDVKNVRVLKNSDTSLLEASLGDSLGDSLEEMQDSEDSFETSFGSLFWNSLFDSLFDSLETSLWDSSRDSLRASLRTSIVYSCFYILDDKPKEAAKFKPLLDLWLAGNFPVGFDEDGNLLVLVADLEPESDSEEAE